MTATEKLNDFSIAIAGQTEAMLSKSRDGRLLLSVSCLDYVLAAKNSKEVLSCLLDAIRSLELLATDSISPLEAMDSFSSIEQRIIELKL